MCAIVVAGIANKERLTVISECVRAYDLQPNYIITMIVFGRALGTLAPASIPLTLLTHHNTTVLHIMLPCYVPSVCSFILLS